MSFSFGSSRRSGSRLAVLVALGALAIPATSHAFCRTTTQPLPANYSPTSGCFTEGLLLFWRNACISYNINEAGSRNVPIEDAKRVIDASFATWTSSVCADTGAPAGITVTNLGEVTCAEVRYNPDSPNQNLIVFRDNGWPYSDPNSTLGLTTVTFNAQTGEIMDADMELNASRRDLSITDQVPANGFDLASVVTHEAGHFLGLAHATDSKATMFASYKPGTTALRSLTPDDTEGLCAIYPSSASRIVSPSVSPSSMLTAAACNANPRHGLTKECFSPVVEDKCSTAPRPHVPFGMSGAAIAVALGLLAARRAHARRSA